MNTFKENQAIANTIIGQLGGNKFIAMTGAKEFIFGIGGNYKYGILKFKLPSNFAKNKINRVSIALNQWDTYDLTFGKMAKSKFHIIKTVNGVFNTELQNVFTEVTGLYTHL